MGSVLDLLQGHSILDVLHYERGQLISEMPQAEVILSVGCADVAYFEWFAGKYPHKIVKHIGVDILPKPDGLASDIEWHQGSFSDLSAIPDSSIDLIFAGQAIEHVPTYECLAFLEHAHRVLRGNGWLVMDSPNFDITRVWPFPNPEHVIEYTPTQMGRVLKDAGFRAIRRKGILLAKEGGKLIHEPYDYERVDYRRLKEAKERPDDSFIWWIEARKTGAFDHHRVARLLTQINHAYERALDRSGKPESHPLNPGAREERTMTGGSLRRAFRRAVPQPIRGILRSIYRLVSGWYIQNVAQHLQDIKAQNVTQVAQTEAQSEIMDLMLRRMRRLEEQITANTSSLEDRLRNLEEELVRPTSMEVGELSEAVRSLEYQAVLLRTHLNASGILGPMNMKSRALRRLFEEAMAQTPPEAAVVEVGCMRYPFESPQEGASTLYFARWCNDANRRFVSIDMEYADNAREILAEQGLSADVMQGDGGTLIAGLSLPIAFLYLDGGNDPADTLAQLKAAEYKLVPGAVVAIDDVQQLDVNPEGKGQLALPYARGRGWLVEILKTEPGYKMAALRPAPTNSATSKIQFVAAERE